MKKLIALLLLFIMVSCNSPSNATTKNNGDIEYKIIEIEGCEYIWYKETFESGQTLTHKGNCKNPIHRKDCK